MSARKAVKSVAKVAKSAAKTVTKDPLGTVVNAATFGGIGASASLLSDATQSAVAGGAPEDPRLTPQPEQIDAEEREASAAVDDANKARRGAASTQVVRSLLGPSGSNRRTLLGV